MAERIKLALSEFKALDNIRLHYSNGIPCANTVKDCIGILIKKGDQIPEIFVKDLALNRPEQIGISTEDGVLQLTKEQQKRYDIDIAEIISKKKAKEPKTDKEVIDRQFPKWDMEKLNRKLAYYIKNYKKEGNSRFKDWCEKEFGEDKIDKRKSPDNLIVLILKWQDEGKV